MKTSLTFAFLLATLTVFGQATELPRTEFKVDVSESRLTLKPGESKQVNLLIIRSKGYAKAVATLGLMSPAINGITVTFEPEQGLVDAAIATISAAPSVAAGDYSIVLSATLNHKKKGAIVKVTVGSEAVAVN